MPEAELQQDALAARADELEAGLSAVSDAASDASAVLRRLSTHLTKLTGLSEPIYEQAVRLTWAQQNITAAKEATDRLAQHLQAPRQLEPALRQGPGRDLDAYLALMRQLQEAMCHLEDMHTLGVARRAHGHASKLLEAVMKDCEADFVAVLTQQSAASLPSVTALVQQAEQESLEVAVSRPMVPDFAPAAMARLKALAGVLQKQSTTCYASYAKARAKALQELLQGLGVPMAAVSTSQVLTPEQAEKNAAAWGRQLQALTLATASELVLGRTIWGASQARQTTGAIVAKPLSDVAVQCRTLCKARNMQAAHVFALLDMMQHLQASVPLLEKLLRDSTGCQAALDAAREAQDQLGSTAKELLQTFMGGVAKDASKAQVMDGTVHPLTASVLSFLRRLFTYGRATDALFLDGGRGGGAMAELSEQVARKRMKVAVEGCMEGLMQSLDSKAKAYKSRALGAVFLLNNVHYVVTTVDASEQLSLLGRTWVEKHKDIVEKHCQEYHEAVWMPVVRQLQAVQSGEDPQPKDTSKRNDWIKRHFKAVNALLEKVGEEQGAWSIPDPRLRTAVTRVVCQDFLPPYEDFWEKYSQADFTSNHQKYVRFSPKRVENMVQNEMFTGGAAPGADTPAELSASQPLSARRSRLSETSPSIAGLARSGR